MIGRCTKFRIAERRNVIAREPDYYNKKYRHRHDFRLIKHDLLSRRRSHLSTTQIRAVASNLRVVNSNIRVVHKLYERLPADTSSSKVNTRGYLDIRAVLQVNRAVTKFPSTHSRSEQKTHPPEHAPRMGCYRQCTK